MSMSDKEVQRLERWGEKRKAGKTAYVLRYGVLLWGVSTALLWSLVMHFLSPNEEPWLRVLIALAVFPLSGIAFGLMTWAGAEKRYRDYWATLSDDV